MRRTRHKTDLESNSANNKISLVIYRKFWEICFPHFCSSGMKKQATRSGGTVKCSSLQFNKSQSTTFIVSFKSFFNLDGKKSKATKEKFNIQNFRTSLHAKNELVFIPFRSLLIFSCIHPVYTVVAIYTFHYICDDEIMCCSEGKERRILSSLLFCFFLKFISTNNSLCRMSWSMYVVSRVLSA